MKRWLSICVTAVLLAGCASGVRLDEPAPVEDRSSQTTAPQQAAGSQTEQRSVAAVDLSKQAMPDSVSETARVIYFDFDSFVIKDEFRPTVESHAKYMSTNRGRKMVIEGHADERGSREYNLALGQKRSEAVRRALELLGVADAQVEAVSYGEERPAATGSDETAWSKNRRAELNYR